MAFRYSVSLAKILKDNTFEVLHMPKDPTEILISSRDINRPGLLLSGFEEYFDSGRINFLGKTEMGYIESYPEEVRRKKVELFMSKKPACVVVTRSLPCPDELLEFAEKYEVPLLVTNDTTSRSMAALIGYLNVELAERITRHGVLVEIYGEGVTVRAEGIRLKLF